MRDDVHVVQVTQCVHDVHAYVKAGVTDRTHVETFSFHPGEGMISVTILHKYGAVW